MRINKYSGSAGSYFRYPQYVGSAVRSAHIQQYYQESVHYAEHEAKRDLRFLKRHAITLGVLLLGAALVWTIVSFVFSGKASIGELKQYTSQSSAATYSYNRPANFIESKDTTDDAVVFKDKAGESAKIVLRSSSLYVGELSVARIDGVLAALKDQNSAINKSFVSGVTFGSEYKDIRIGQFSGFQNQHVAKGVVASVSATNSQGKSFIGQLIVVYGAKNQYSFVMLADKDSWNANKSTWQSIQDSITIQ